MADSSSIPEKYLADDWENIYNRPSQSCDGRCCCYICGYKFFAHFSAGYYPLFDCRYVASGGWCRIEDIPSIADNAIREHFGIRNKGWMNQPPLFQSPSSSGVFCGQTLTYINERHCEVLKTVGLLREAQHQVSNYCDKFNREYKVQLCPLSLIHGEQATCLEQYFYAILNVTDVQLPSDAFAENGTALPEPGTQVTITPKVHGSKTRETWTGVVVKSPNFPSGTVAQPPKAVVIRIRVNASAVNWECAGIVRVL
ncbi:uncharacterized protein KD926_010636 [Aspergillus affinis]|uniref:uncharacterized protein n=1 Tax=Aspergillus affinis TaxID=1070780 RepID=UPI0022FE97D5|nr:uncharacterized protein KD926_010636 [Aspergillus affinis]KAI9038591.1 hypothetical protein KD926_010636 [Aspergillus affinis]